jgi:hypothetical protein
MIAEMMKEVEIVEVVAEDENQTEIELEIEIEEAVVKVATRTPLI